MWMFIIGFIVCWFILSAVALAFEEFDGNPEVCTWIVGFPLIAVLSPYFIARYIHEAKKFSKKIKSFNTPSSPEGKYRI